MVGDLAIRGMTRRPRLLASADMESRMIQAQGVALHVGVTGEGPDLVVLSGGRGCVEYLKRDEISSPGHRAWYPEARGIARSDGGPRTMQTAIADLEGIREAVGVGSWIVLGHSRGSDLDVRYAAAKPLSPSSTSTGCPRRMSRSANPSPIGTSHSPSLRHRSG